MVARRTEGSFHMNERRDAQSQALDQMALAKFGVGQPVTRREDLRLLQGQGQYTDDVNLPGQAYAAFVRSQVPHGVIRSVDTAAASAMPGVLAIYTGADMASAGYGSLPNVPPFKNPDGSPMKKPARPALTSDKVRFVGDAIACVVAETLQQAQDAAEAVTVDINALPAVVDMRAAARPDAPQLYADVPGNLSLDYHYGDAQKTEAAFKAAHHVTRLSMTNNRVVVNPMEPRAAVAAYDAGAERFTLYSQTQGVFGSAATAAKILNMPAKSVRFVSVNVGGSFGMKAGIFPEYVVCLHGARALGRPVKWTDTRTEAFVSDHHGRAQDFDCELALDKDGHFLALRLDGYGDMGAYLSAMQPLFSTLNIVKHTASCYRTPLLYVRTRCVFTNTVPVTAYRGAGRPEGNYYMERLIETAAAEMGIDAIELRRRNHIQPDQLPFTASSGSVYDSGNFPAILDKAMELSDWPGYAQRKAASEAKGLIRGRGVGQFLEMTAGVVNELAEIAFDADGGVTITTGSHDHGQGHWTPFAQILVEKLGVPFAKIRLMQSDSDKLRAGSGTGGSKSLISSGTAIVEASDRVIDKGRQAAAHFLEASAGDVAFADGRFSIVGTDRGIAIMELAGRLATATNLPDDVPKTLDVSYVHETAPATYPNGCHICEVEIDPSTGEVEIEKYTMVGDFGTMVNPLIVEGQLHGGVVQGIGQCLMETAVYTDDGQLASGSFMDYAMPRAVDIPDFTFYSLPDPAKVNPLGAKGCGEAGVAGAMTSVMNAIVDALRPYGVRHVDMPATPEKVWSLIATGRKRAA